MSKSVLTGKLKVVAVLALAAAALFAVRLILIHHSTIGVSQETGAQPLHETVTNDRLKQMDGTGLIKAAENANLTLSIDGKDGNIEVLDKAAGYVWRSKPAPEEVKQDPSNNLWKNNLQSPLVVEYVKSYTETVPTFANVFTVNTKVTIYALEDGARAYYEFESLGIKMAVDYYLHDDHLEVEVPQYMIEEPADVYVTGEHGRRTLDSDKFRKIVAYSVLPFFGAVQDGAPRGYLLVPDGPGALIRFDKSKKGSLNFTGTVYGSDLSYANKFDSSLNAGLDESKVFYPAFGINRGDRSMLAVIHSGESGAEIVGNPAGVNTGFYSAYAHFKFREKYKKLTDLTGAGVFLYTEFSVNVTRNIKYYMLNGEKSNYAGMAETYRKYLMKEKGLTRKPQREGDLPLELRIMGGVEKDGFLASRFIPMTTFRQATEMLGYFRQNGIRHMTVVYEGWAKGGKSVAYPNRFPAASRLGGTMGLKRLIEQAHQFGYRVLLEDDHMRALTGKGVSERNDIVRSIQNAPLDIGESGKREQVLNPGAVARFLDKSMQQYRKLNADGIEERGLGVLNSDFNAANPMNREEIKRKYEETVAAMVKELGTVRLWRGMAFHLTNGVSIENAAADYSFSPIVDEVVPFYQLALHGLVDYVTVPYNLMDEPERELLKAVEYGANVSFIVTAGRTELLKDAPDADLYSSEFGIWREDILKLYGKVNAALGGVSGSFMTGHGEVDRDVYRTAYEDGTEIVVNYSDSPYVYKGKTAAAKGFVVIKGSGGHQKT